MPDRPSKLADVNFARRSYASSAAPRGFCCNQYAAAEGDVMANQKVSSFDRKWVPGMGPEGNEAQRQRWP